MKGMVLGFNESKAEGVIRGNDENRYKFLQSEFNAEQAPAVGLEVDFEIEDGVAKDIYIAQKAASQGVNLEDMQAKAQEMQAKAANVLGDISSNTDVIKAKETAVAALSNNPISIALIAIYAIAVFFPLVDIHVGGGRGWQAWGFNIEMSFFEMALGKIAFVVAVAALVLVVLEITKYVKLLVISMFLLPIIAIIVEISSFAALIGRKGVSGSSTRVLESFLENGIGIGVYILLISALILLFKPIKKQGE